MEKAELSYTGSARTNAVQSTKSSSNDSLPTCDEIQDSGILDALIRKLTGRNDVRDYINLIAERLKDMHKMEPKDKLFLSIGDLRLFEEHLIPLKKFSTPKPEFENGYNAIQI